MRDRSACCEDPKNRCETRWTELRAWVAKHTGKGVRLVTLAGDEQGRRPFFAQPVGYDGRTFFLAADGLCDTEKLLHEACHFFASPRQRRNTENYGLGPGPFRPVDDLVSDNEEVTAALLQQRLAPYFALPAHKMQRPDYNCASRRNVDWDVCEARAEELFARVVALLPSVTPKK